MPPGPRSGSASGSRQHRGPQRASERRRRRGGAPSPRVTWRGPPHVTRRRAPRRRRLLSRPAPALWTLARAAEPPYKPIGPRRTLTHASVSRENLGCAGRGPLHPSRSRSAVGGPAAHLRGTRTEKRPGSPVPLPSQGGSGHEALPRWYRLGPSAKGLVCSIPTRVSSPRSPDPMEST